MSDPAFVVTLLGLQLGFTALDLIQRHRTRAQRYHGEAPRAQTLAFLGAVVSVYLVVQLGLTALAPHPGAVIDSLRSATLAPMPTAAVWLLAVAALYVGGLIDYAVHRFLLHGRLWALHEYHHLPSQIFLAMPGIAARPFSALSTTLVTVGTLVLLAAGLATLGLPVWDLRPLKIAVIAQAFLLLTAHSCWMRAHPTLQRPLRWLGLITADEHLVHHTVDRPGNYGNLTTVWDHLFGTWRPPSHADGARLGLGYEQDFLGALTLDQAHLPLSWRARFQLHRYLDLGDGEARQTPETRTAPSPPPRLS